MFESGRPIAHVAAALGLPPETLRKRVRQGEIDTGRRQGFISSALRAYGPSPFVDPRRATALRNSCDQSGEKTVIAADVQAAANLEAVQALVELASGTSARPVRPLAVGLLVLTGW